MTIETDALTCEWLECAQTKGRLGFQLFCFPHAGGGTKPFLTWAQKVPEWMQICAVQLPGHGRRRHEHPFNCLVPLVAAIAEGIKDHIRGPFAFYGHSMGALIGFELARLMRSQAGIEPSHLFVSASSAPQLLASGVAKYDLPQNQFLEELRRMNGTPHEVLQDAGLMEILLPTLRADFAVCDTYEYHPEAPLACPITAIGAISDQEVSIEELHAWHVHTTASFKIFLLRGNHFFINHSSDTLLESICAELANRQPAISGEIVNRRIAEQGQVILIDSPMNCSR